MITTMMAMSMITTMTACRIPGARTAEVAAGGSQNSDGATDCRTRLLCQMQARCCGSQLWPQFVKKSSVQEHRAWMAGEDGLRKPFWGARPAMKTRLTEKRDAGSDERALPDLFSSRFLASQASSNLPQPSTSTASPLS